VTSRLRVTNRTRGTVLGSDIVVADTWWSRLRGFLARPRPEAGEGILLSPCRAVHMWGMRYPLDVIFLDNSGDIVAVEEELRPWRTSSMVPEARYVLEVPAGTVRATGTSVGDRCAWTRNEAPRPQETL
jgi:uncharacterized membrane protein (UPF0127 family)